MPVRSFSEWAFFTCCILIAALIPLYYFTDKP